MTDYPPPKPPLPVKITTGPHGNRTELFINGEKVTNAYSFTLTADANDAVRLTVSYINLDVEVDALIDTTAMGSVNKTWKQVILRSEDEPDEPEADEVA